MAALSSCLIEGLWAELSAALPRPNQSDLRVGRASPDRLAFDKLVLVAKTGISYDDAGDDRVSASTIRRRRNEWQAAGLGDLLLQIALADYDRMIGLQLENVAVDGCITKAPCGGEVAGRSPVDPGKQGFKRSVITEGKGRAHGRRPRTGQPPRLAAFGPDPGHPQTPGPTARGHHGPPGRRLRLRRHRPGARRPRGDCKNNGVTPRAREDTEVTETTIDSRPDLTDAVDEQLAAQLVARASSQGVSLIGEGGLLQKLTKMVLESASRAR